MFLTRPLSARKFFFIFLSLLTLCLISVPIAVFTVDPWQMFRQDSPRLYDWGYLRTYQPGRIINWDYESILLGSSLSREFSPTLIDSCFHTQSLIVPTTSADAYENIEMLRLSAKHHKLKLCLFELNFNAMSYSEKNYHNSEIFRRLLNEDYLFYLTNEDACKAAYTLNELPVTNREEMFQRDSSYTQMPYIQQRFYSAILHVKEFKTSISRAQYLENEADKQRCFSANFEHDIMPFFRHFIAAHPDIKIYFFIPPYSLLYHQLTPDVPQTFNRLKNNAFACVEKLSELGDNVKIYDFITEEKLIGNFSFYYDYQHFIKPYNDYIIEAMAADSHRITPQNMEERFENLQRQIQAYDYDALFDKVNALPDSEFLSQ